LPVRYLPKAIKKYVSDKDAKVREAALEALQKLEEEPKATPANPNPLPRFEPKPQAPKLPAEASQPGVIGGPAKFPGPNSQGSTDFFNRGMVNLEKGFFDQAIRDFNQAIQLDPQRTEAYEKRELAYKKKLKAGPIPGYKDQVIEGFHVLIANDVLAHNDDPMFQRNPIDVLKLELGTVASVLPSQAVRALRTIPIWVEWNDEFTPDKALAKYYAGGLWPLDPRKHPLKSNCVEICNMMALTAEHQPNSNLDRCIILHELAHAVHFQIFGPSNLAIKQAYQQAIERKLYDSSRDVFGNMVTPYARTNELEYFAELSCAYFNKLSYFPFTREELRKYDPVGFRMMELTWGKNTPKGKTAN
jgi:tetratricopeptide (TPR) repeat protein